MIQHKHLVVRAEIMEPPVKSAFTEAMLNKSIDDLIVSIGMKVVLPARSIWVSKEGNEGYTGQAGLETSHITYHIWNNPDRSIVLADSEGLIQFDLYTCGCLGTEEINKVMDWLDMFTVLTAEYKVFDRSVGLEAITNEV